MKKKKDFTRLQSRDQSRDSSSCSERGESLVRSQHFDYVWLWFRKDDFINDVHHSVGC